MDATGIPAQLEEVLHAVQGIRFMLKVFFVMAFAALGWFVGAAIDRKRQSRQKGK